MRATTPIDLVVRLLCTVALLLSMTPAVSLAESSAAGEPSTAVRHAAARSGLGEVVAAESAALAVEFKRVAGSDRFSTAVAIGKESYPGWSGVAHVVVASGDDRAAADPLAASGLCWAYDAPLLLTSAGASPSKTLQALREIKAANPGVKVHVVGGPVSVPDARLKELRAIAGSSSVERLPYGDRYVTAAAIMDRVVEVADAEGYPLMPIAFVANGADPGKFFDALAVATVSSSIGAPILLVAQDQCPSATARALGRFKPDELFVAGGPMTVSDGLMDWMRGRFSSSVRRLSGKDRYETALAIAVYGMDRGWLSPDRVVFAAKLPDALTGGGLAGRIGAFMLVVPGDSISRTVASYLKAREDTYEYGAVLGGHKSVTWQTYGDLRGFVHPDHDVVYRVGSVDAWAETPNPPHDGVAYYRFRVFDQFGLGIDRADIYVSKQAWKLLGSDVWYDVGGSGGYYLPGEPAWTWGLGSVPGYRYSPGQRLRCVVTATAGGTSAADTAYFDCR